MAILKKIIPPVLFIFLISCSSMPISTMFKLYSINPLSIDAEQIAVAVVSPQYIGVKDGDVVLTIKFKSDNPNMNFNDRYYVKVSSNPIYSEELSHISKSDNHIVFLKLSPDDVKNLNSKLKKVREYRANSSEGAGSMNLEILSACSIGQNNNYINESIDVYLKTSIKDDFFIFLDNIKTDNLRDANNCN
ncbi:hypothetical protein [Shewanella sp. YIC-542]|uniref:hypothetical protein n=1 Tax=Shewanella mytili TaxID=3377111 RepID=UPI00398F6589